MEKRKKQNTTNKQINIWKNKKHKQYAQTNKNTNKQTTTKMENNKKTKIKQ